MRRVMLMGIAICALAEPAMADDNAGLTQEIQKLQDDVAAQQQKLREQQERLQLLERKLQGEDARRLDSLRGGQAAGASGSGQASTTAPVGVAPAEQRPEVQALSDVGGVLNPAGRLTLEPSFEYDNFQENRFFFAGTEIVNAVFIGGFTATNARRNTLTAALTGRYGITDRLQVDLRVPYVFRADRVSDPTGVGTALNSAYGSDIGDIEATGHYQLNSGAGGGAYYVTNLRVKSATGTGPFDVPYSPDGFQQRLPTGSGFWTVEPSLTVLYPSDPVVLYGNLGYAYTFSEDINKTLNTPNGPVTFGTVQPGGTLRASFGLGFGINDHVSLSLGYEHDYVMSTTSNVVGGPTQNSEELQIGQFLFGLSYVVSPATTVNINLAVGATRDAPDVRLMFSVPIAFDLR